MNNDQTKLRAALMQWRESLVNLGGRNKLLNYRPTKASTIEFARLEPAEVLDLITTGGGVYTIGTKPTIEPAADEADLEVEALEAIESFDYGRFKNHLFAERTQLEVDRILKNLAQTAKREYLDKGLSILYLALGVLKWKEDSGDERRSPLLFVPVSLESDGPKHPYRLLPSSEDRVVNLALTIKLREYGITLPSIDEIESALDDGGLQTALDLFRALDLPVGWQVEDLASLSTFMFAKEAMFRDLEANESIILESPLLGAIADPQFGGDHANYLFDPADEQLIDSVAPPEEAPLVLDADSSQRVAVAAARDGKSFVLDGPPGTGKSQTIANIIATLIHDGKRVLFVSEKAVALDVVRDRLADRGLGSFILELHSHKAARSAVAGGIAKALDTKVVPARRASSLTKPNAAALRQELSGYADAMNEIREPLQHSIHDVLGLVEATGEMSAAMPPVDFQPAKLDLAELERMRAAIREAERYWAVLLRGRGDPWYAIENLDGLEFAARSASNAARTLSEELRLFPNRDSLRLGLMSSWESIDRVLTRFRERSAFGTGWLTVPSFSAVETQATEYLAAGRARLESETLAKRLAGDDWRRVQVVPLDRRIGPALSAAYPDAPQRSVDDLASITPWMVEIHRRMSAVQLRAVALADTVGIAPATGPAEASTLGWLANAALDPNAPSSEWVRSEAALSRARATLAGLRTAILNEDAAKKAAQEYFTPSVLEIDARAISDRLSRATGIKRLGTAARADRRAIAAVAARSPKEALQRFGLAVTWQEQREVLRDEWANARAPLAPYGEAPFGEEVEAAFRNAEAIVHHASVVNWTAMDEALNAEGQRALAREARDQLSAAMAEWSQVTSAARDTTLAATLEGSFEEISHRLEQVQHDLDELLDPLAQSANIVGRASTPAELWTIVEAVASAIDHNDELDRTRQRLDPLIAQLSPSGQPDELEEVQRHLDWARAVRADIADCVKRDPSDPLSPEEVGLLIAARTGTELRVTGATWNSRLATLLGHFSEEQRPILDMELDDPEEAVELLEYLAANLAAADAALGAREARNALRSLGLEPVLDELVHVALDERDAARHLEHAVLRDWLDYQVKNDQRLRGRTGAERDTRVSEYRSVDRAVLDDAALDVINAASQRKPSSNFGQSALVRREGEKKRRHIPVRDLMDRARDVVQAVHPCFMMSPLAVSQYLPPDMKFDYVIFDEASQVMPADAVNCIYRGKSLIAAGDQKQLPPTAFFMNATSTDDEDDEADLASDYESVLDLMKSSGAFNSITLRWHYRSRHEHLIAFSNASFYDSRLITFPSAIDEDDHLGVKFHLVDGIYRRAGARDNPIEAKAVAARVLHHFETRPEESIGVVAFSAAQRDTIENALSVARGFRPELDKHFAEGRLDGLFVKSLEEVQGDERDVIVLSVGYGPDENGKVYRNFGPINQKGGHRRLNVAVTRARKLVEVVSSVSASLIADTGSEGVRHFRRYLDYAERGPAALAYELGPEGRDTESPFEDSVVDVIRSMGFNVQPQVGVAGYRVDIGVIHPDRPGAFLLGVECDGAQYHSSRTARDRDRLRHELLEGLGWRIHHIWGTAWYRNRSNEIERLREVLDEQLTGAHIGRAVRSPQRAVELDEVESAPSSEAPAWAVPYEFVTVRNLPRVDLSDEHNAWYLVKFVDTVVEGEGPIHLDLLSQRLREASGIGRVGRLIKKTLLRAVQLSNATRRDGDFLLQDDQSVQVRAATALISRTVAQVHPSEIQLAVLSAMNDAGGASRSEITTAVARAFGWIRTGSEVSAAIERELDVLVRAGSLTETASGFALTRN